MLWEWRGAGLGMAIASSVGIRQFLRRIQVSRNHLTGFTPVHVVPLDPADAERMLAVAALAADQRLDWWNEPLVRAVIEQSANLLPVCLQSISGSTRTLRSRTFAELADAVKGALAPRPADDAGGVDTWPT